MGKGEITLNGIGLVYIDCLSPKYPHNYPKPGDCINCPIGHPVKDQEQSLAGVKPK